jgi:hypothetical protein
MFRCFEYTAFLWKAKGRHGTHSPFAYWLADGVAGQKTKQEIMAKIGSTPFVLVVESLNRRTGLGIRFGSWLLERGFSPKYAYMGTHQEGCSGIWEQLPHQGIDTIGIMNKVEEMLK